jgi:mRNA interferase YafQ
MRRVSQHARFHADLRRQRRRGKNIEELIAVVELLAETGSLPEGYGPHQLSGEWKGVSECHIDPDRLLIYA